MNIVIEGPDGSGKSTLARTLREAFGMQIYSSPGPSKTREAFKSRVVEYSMLDNVIFDRHPIISEHIYGHFRGEMMCEPDDVREFYEKNPVLIYCTGSRGPQIKKEHDTQEHLELIEQNAYRIMQRYENWAKSHAMFWWRGKNKNRFISAIRAVAHPFDPVQDVRRFHEKFEIAYNGKPRMLDFETLQFRLKFMREELNEYEQHCDRALAELDPINISRDDANFLYHMAGVADSLADLLYVALGTAHLHGFPFREIWRRVHVANMAKQKGEDADYTSRLKMKIVKPPEWEAPCHEDLLENHAHLIKVNMP